MQVGGALAAFDFSAPGAITCKGDVCRPNRHWSRSRHPQNFATYTFRFSRYVEGDFSTIMSSLSSTSKAVSGVGFLGMAAVITLHKASAVAERAHHKPDKEAHEVRINRGVCACKRRLVSGRDRTISREARPHDLDLAISNSATSVPTERKSVCREQ